MEIDCIDTGNDALLNLEMAGALEPIDYKSFTLTDPADIDPPVKLPYQVGSFTYAFVMGYNTGVFPPGKEPKSWEQFWDLKAFPGARTLADMASGAPNLEFALIADGVPMDKVFPIDIPRAFKSLSRIKSSVPKFWDTGALSAQMMADKEAVLGVLWSTRLQVAADGGAPLGTQWNQNEILVQSYGITKGSKNVDAALKFIDYSLSPEVQARILSEALPYMQRYDEEIVVVKYGGHAMGAEDLAREFAGDPHQCEGLSRDLTRVAGSRDETALDKIEGLHE